MLLARRLTEQVIGLAIEVHRLTSLGLLEPVYEGYLCHEPAEAEIPFIRQAGIPVRSASRSGRSAIDSGRVIPAAVDADIPVCLIVIPADAGTHDFPL